VAGKTKKLTPAQERKKLQTEKAELQRQLDEANRKAAERDEAALDAVLKEDAETPVENPSDLADPELVHDPFAGQNPHVIKANPPGFILGWKSERYRERRGMRGWMEISYDDEYGKNLDKYIDDPPHRMKHHTDMFVRRGDVILCRLPEAMWKARQQQRVEKANRLLTNTQKGDDVKVQVDRVASERSLVPETDRAKSMLR
jgi:hypothetical protein